MNFLTNAEKMKDAIGVNYIMALNQLPSIPEHWDCNHFVVVIQNIFMRIRYQERDLNHGFHVLVAMVTCTKLICILIGKCNNPIVWKTERGLLHLVL